MVSLYLTVLNGMGAKYFDGSCFQSKVVVELDSLFAKLSSVDELDAGY